MSELTYNPELKEHSHDFDKKVWQVADNVYSAVGFSIANSMMVVGDDGVVIIDAMDCVEAAEQVMAEFRKVTDKPVKAIIYTHYHQDHTFGVRAFADPANVGKSFDVYGHEKLVGNIAKSNILLGPITRARAAYMYGRHLPPGDEGHLNDGIGPAASYNTISFVAPNKIITDKLDVTVAGINMEIIYVPSETDDEIAVWLPDQHIIFTAETINPTFPNCYTVRGTPYRDTTLWYRSIDRMRRYNAEIMVPSHGNPQLGREQVQFVMTSYRDIIQYVHDQTVRLVNLGYNADEIAEMIELPDHLASIKPYGREYYGTVKHVVRGIYDGYLGWFNADPANLNPLPPKERARAYVELAGGKEAMLGKLQKAVAEEDWRWAAEMATWLIRAEPALTEAKELKARALRQMAYTTINSSWRNFYLEAALELEGKIPSNFGTGAQVGELLKQFPIYDILQNFAVRLNPQTAVAVELTIAFKFSDSGENYAIAIRRGVAEIMELLPEKYDAALVTDRAGFQQLLANPTGAPNLVARGQLSFEGDPAEILRFFGYFERPDNQFPKLADR